MTPFDGIFIDRYLSPNFNRRPENQAPDMVILHYTGMESGDAACDRLCDPAAEVSAHYLVWEDGTIDQMVDPLMRAWHAGVSHWAGRDNLNHYAVGIEIVNTGKDAFPERQMQAVLALCQYLKARFDIAQADFMGHSDIAPTRKDDPGPLFDWSLLAAGGIGLMPQPLTVQQQAESEKASRQDICRWLIALGYAKIDVEEDFGYVISAVQQHWLPAVYLKYTAGGLLTPDKKGPAATSVDAATIAVIYSLYLQKTADPKG